jgi:hypothetical protein
MMLKLYGNVIGMVWIKTFIVSLFLFNLYLYKQNIKIYYKFNENQKLVAKYNLKNEIITIYSSMSFAAMDNSISVSSISAVCNPSRINKTAGGYIWKFIEN